LALAAFSLLLSGCREESSCWKRTIPGGSSIITFSDVHGLSADRVYVVGEYSQVYKWDGLKWKSMPGSWGGHSVFPFAEDDIFVAGGRSLVHYDGNSWNEISRVSCQLESIWGFPHSDVFVAGGQYDPNDSYKKACVFHYDGESFVEMPLNEEIPIYLWDIWGTSPWDMYAVGADDDEYPPHAGIILHFDGSSWSIMKDDLPYGLFGIWGASPTDIFAVGDKCHVLHFDGFDWSEMETPCKGELDKALTGLRGFSGTQVYVVGARMLYYDGISWTDMSEGLPAYVGSIWGTSVADLVAVGYTFIYPYTVGAILQYTCPEPE